MKVEVIPKKVNGEGDQLIDVEDLVAEKEEECLNERFQKHFAIRGFNGKFEKFNKIAQDFSKSRKFLNRFWFKRIMVIFFNLLSKYLPRFLYSRLLVAICQSAVPNFEFQVLEFYHYYITIPFSIWSDSIVPCQKNFIISIVKMKLLYQLFTTTMHIDSGKD